MNSKGPANQFAWFLGVGLLQYALDFLLFTALFTMLHPSVLFNVVSRLLAACAGYLLNGLLTFRAGAKVRSKARVGRFVVVWLSLTLASTLVLAGVKMLAADSGMMAQWVVMTKLAFEAILVILSFQLQKHWVFGPNESGSE